MRRAWRSVARRSVRPPWAVGRGPAGPAHRHRQGELAHEPGQHQQLGRGQLGEVLAREPFRGAGDHRRAVSVSSSGAGFLILVLALGDHLLGLGQLGLLGRAFLGGVHAGGRAAWVKMSPGDERAAPGPRRPAGRPAGPPARHAAEHRAEDPVQRLDLRLAGDQGGECAQVEGAAAGGPGHRDGARETLTTARIGRAPPRRAGPRRTGRRSGPGRHSSPSASPPKPAARTVCRSSEYFSTAPASVPPTRCPGRRCPAPGGPAPS